jgi:hypothetical protein
VKRALRTDLDPFADGTFSSVDTQTLPPRRLWPKERRMEDSGSDPIYGLRRIKNACLNLLGSLEGRPAVSQNMPLLSRVLGTAALASVIMTLLMSYQWSGAAEAPAAKVIRPHPK